MKKFIVHVFTEIFDDDFYNIIQVREKFKSTYKTDIEFNEIEDKFYGLIGEGLAVSSDYTDDTAYFRINLIGDREIETLLEFLSRFEKIDEELDFTKDFSNFDYSDYIQIDSGDVCLDNEIKLKIKDYLLCKNIDFKILRGNEIYEKGASSYWVVYLIAVGAGLSVELIKGIYSLIKDKIYDKDDIKSISVKETVKTFLITEYNLKPTDIYLSRFFKRHESDIIELTYKSKAAKYYIETNNTGEIIKAKKTKFIKSKNKVH